MSSKVVDIKDKMKEGWLEKESRFRKVLRKRWCVLTEKTLYTFKEEKMYVDPTEQIEISLIKTTQTEETKMGKDNDEFFFVRNYI